MEKNNETMMKDEEMAWDSAEKFLASTIIQGIEKQVKAWSTGAFLLAAVLGGVIVGLIMVNHSQSKMFYENDSQWRNTVEKTNQSWIDYLSDYDFISQDGEGINNINTGEQGDLMNGPERKDQER